LLFGGGILLFNFLCSGIVLLNQIPEIKSCFVINCVIDEETIFKKYGESKLLRIMTVINVIAIFIFKMAFKKILK